MVDEEREREISVVSLLREISLATSLERFDAFDLRRSSTTPKVLVPNAVRLEEAQLAYVGDRGSLPSQCISNCHALSRYLYLPTWGIKVLPHYSLRLCSIAKAFINCHIVSCLLPLGSVSVVRA